MKQVGSRAPDFELPGVTRHASDTYSLESACERGRTVVLTFYPFDFSPVCTMELCSLRDAEFLDLYDDVCLWAISGDSIYAHRVFAEEYDLDFTLLSDSDGSVARSFGACYDQWEGHRNVPKRSVFVVDEGRVAYAWATDDAYERPDFFPVADALDRLGLADRRDLPERESTDLRGPDRGPTDPLDPEAPDDAGDIDGDGDGDGDGEDKDR